MVFQAKAFVRAPVAARAPRPFWPDPSIALLVFLWGAATVFSACTDDAAVVVAPARLVVEPLRVDMGEVPVGGARILELLLTSTGQSVLELTIGEGAPFDSDVLSFEPAAGRIAPGATLAVELVFRPLQVGPSKSVLRIESNALDAPFAEVEVLGQGIRSTLSVRPAALDFGQVPLGATRIRSVTLHNPSQVETEAVDVRGLGIPLCEDAPLRGAPFCLVLGKRELDGLLRLSARESTSFEVKFSPATPEPARGEMVMRSCPRGCETRVQLVGLGVASALRCLPEALHFEDLRPGLLRTATVTCQNVTETPITVLGHRLAEASDPEFRIGPDATRRLDAREGLDIEVTFAPTRLGSSTGEVIVELDSDSPARRRLAIPLAGTGAGPEIHVLPERLSFGRVSRFAPTRKSFVVFNAGHRPLTVEEIEIDGGETSSFRFSGPEPAILPPGESQTFTVELQPAVVGPIEARARIHSNDPGQPVVDLPMEGRGEDLGPCEFRVPRRLSFGAAQVGRTLRRAIEVANTGQELCLLTGARLVAGSADAFRLPLGEIGSLEIPARESRTLPVELTPTLLGPVSARLELSLSSPTNPFPVIDLAGAGSRGEIVVAPSEIDFGRVGVECRSRAEPVRIYNTGASALRILSIALDGPSGQAFSLLDAPFLPRGGLDVPSGRSVQLSLGFGPAAVREHVGALEIQASVDGLPETFVVALAGRGAAGAHQVDTFEQLGRPSADILFVIDKTTSMSEEQAALVANLSRFLRFALAEGLDFQIGVTTTHTNAQYGGEAGRITSAPHGTRRMSSVDGPPLSRIVTPRSLPSPEAVFAANVSYGLRGGPPDEEAGLRAAEQALSPALLSTHNAGLIRPGAVLSIVIVSDAQDHSPASIDHYVSFFRSIKGARNANLLSLSAVVAPYPPGACEGPSGSAYSSGRYEAAARRTGGALVSICTSDWARDLEALGQTAFGFRTKFFLNSPADEDTLRVYIDGLEVPRSGAGGTANWRYDVASSSLSFAPYATPEPFSEIRVEYAMACL